MLFVVLDSIQVLFVFSLGNCLLCGWSRVVLYFVWIVSDWSVSLTNDILLLRAGIDGEFLFRFVYFQFDTEVVVVIR